MASQTKETRWSALRILDFFYLFPGLIRTIRMPAHLRKWKDRFSAAHNRFFYPSISSGLFMQMEPIQSGALKTLVAREMLQVDGVLDRDPTIRIGSLTEHLQHRIDAKAEESEELLSFLIGLSQIHVLGYNGLKDRTRLMEYRYDPV